MSDFSVVVENLEPNTLVIETSFLENIQTLEIERYINSASIISQSNIIDVSDLPDIPFSKITGFLDVSRITGLDSYLDSYSFDCGTP